MSSEDGDDSNSIFERINHRLPKSGDQLLKKGLDAEIYSDIGERNYRLLRGYKFAGDLLVQRALTDRVEKNNLIFPALFSYRHYIELALKSSILEHGQFVSVSLDKPNHNLKELWKKFLQIAQVFHCTPTEEVAVSVESCIVELDTIDSNSIAFRYATNQRGLLPALPAGLNLKNLHDVMNGIENFFECADLEFTDKAQTAYESRYNNMS